MVHLDSIREGGVFTVENRVDVALIRDGSPSSYAS